MEKSAYRMGIAIEAMGLNPKRIVKINLATQRGLGTSDPSKIEVQGSSVDDVTIRVAPHLSLHDLLGADRLIVTQQALKVLEEVWQS